MRIQINQQEKEIESGQKLEELLLSLQQDTSGIAIAINQEIISKDQWANFQLKENDSILMIQATQGG